MAIHSCKNQETYFEPNFANTAHETFYSMTVPFGPGIWPRCHDYDVERKQMLPNVL
jgi:hypothetical protein